MIPRQVRITWLQAALLLIMFGLALGGIRGQGPTFDEQGFLARGVAYLRGANQHIRVGHPLGLNALNGLFVAFDPETTLPVNDPSWSGTDFHRPSELFLWEIGNDVDRVMFLGRLPTVWLGLLLAALVGRWAGALSGRPLAGLLALLLLAFDPNILAHMRLATTDLGLTAAALLAGFTLWRCWRRPGWLRAVVAGIAFGLLQNTKFTAGLFVPLFALVILVLLLARRNRLGPSASWRPLLLFAVLYPLAAILTLWAAYGFQVGMLPDDLPTMSRLGGLTLPLSHHLEQLLDIGGRLQKATPSFLLGRYSDSGWWYYFPVAFVLKTSLPALLLLAWAFWRLARQWTGRSAPSSHLALPDVAALLIPSLGYFAFALTTDINLGYRHLLPVLPFLYVLVGVLLAPLLSPQTRERSLHLAGRAAVLILLAWLAAASLWIRPHFLAYFNLLAGGPDGGWRYLVDSNIDWGQDLQGLASWLEENGIERVWLSYFGEARPDYYGINYTGLDSFPPRLMNPEAQPFYPDEPAPGIYAISATNLQGVHFQDHDRFAWFRERPPVDKVGYSIFVYDVPAFGRPANLALGGLQLDQIRPQDFALWQTNDVTPRWFDPTHALLLPGSDSAWLVLAMGTELPPSLAEAVSGLESVRAGTNYRIYPLPAEPGPVPAPLASFKRQQGAIALLEASIQVEDGAVAVQTRWQQKGPPRPVRIFIHLTDPEDRIVSQWDGLGAAWEGWRSGDQLYQIHNVPLPEDIAPGQYRLWTGLYDPGDSLRWLWPDGDRFPLGRLTLGQS